MNNIFLVTLLTSSKIDYLKLSYNCFINQINKDNINYDIVIIVNTLDSKYVKLVEDEFRNKCKVVITESNGMPGKGHNSCLTYFKDNFKYSHLIPIDGDDFVYPWFLESLVKYIKYPYNPDILLLPYSDFITNKQPASIYHKINNYYWSFGLNEENLINDYYNIKQSPFTNEVYNINTLGRFILISRNALNINFSFFENNYFDDLKPTLEVFEYSILYPNKFKIYILNDINLFLYNKLNIDSSTRKFNIEIEQNLNKIQEDLNLIIKDNFLAIRDYDLKKIKVLQNSYDNDYLTKKYKFVENLIKYL